MSVEPIGQGLLSIAEAFAAALRGEPCAVVGLGADRIVLPASRWRAGADESDQQLLRRCLGATVDIGCGPGRMTEALLSQGHAALGIDLVDAAVTLTRARGAMALRRDVFGPIPGEGRWSTALLADGNIGIGGDPVRLLRRVQELIEPDGRIVVDVDEPGGDVRTKRIRLEVGGRRSAGFPWTVVPADRLAALAGEAALRVLELAQWDGRWFAQLVRVG